MGWDGGNLNQNQKSNPIQGPRSKPKLKGWSIVRRALHPFYLSFTLSFRLPSPIFFSKIPQNPIRKKAVIGLKRKEKYRTGGKGIFKKKVMAMGRGERS